MKDEFVRCMFCDLPCSYVTKAESPSYYVCREHVFQVKHYVPLPAHFDFYPGKYKQVEFYVTDDNITYCFCWWFEKPSGFFTIGKFDSNSNSYFADSMIEFPYHPTHINPENALNKLKLLLPLS